MANSRFPPTGGGSGTPGGSNTEVQFNDAGSFGGDSAFTWNKSNNGLTVNGLLAFGNIAVLGSSPAGVFEGKPLIAGIYQQVTAPWSEISMTLGVGSELNPGADVTNAYWGDWHRVRTGGTHAFNTELISLYTDMYHSGTGDLNQGVAGDFEAFNDSTGDVISDDIGLAGVLGRAGSWSDSGTVTLATGVVGDITIGGTGTITEAVAIRAKAFNVYGSDTVPTAIAIKIEPTGYGTDRYAIRSTSTDKSEFAGTIKAAGYKSSDGSTGATGTATAVNTLTVKNGLITSIA